MNQTEFDSQMLRLLGVYHTQRTSQQQRAELYRVLADKPAHLVEKAVTDHIDSSQYFPKPSQLLSLIDKAPSHERESCAVCDGTGWIETTAQWENEAVGEVEQPWLSKCKACGGRG